GPARPAAGRVRPVDESRSLATSTGRPGEVQKGALDRWPELRGRLRLLVRRDHARLRTEPTPPRLDALRPRDHSRPRPAVPRSGVATRVALRAASRQRVSRTVRTEGGRPDPRDGRRHQRTWADASIPR